MAAIKENSAHFPIFILTVMALALVPYTIVQLFRATTRKATTRNCQCSLCFRSGKYRDRIWNLSSTCRNLTLVMLWAIMAVVVYYIKHSSREIQVFEPFNILGLQHGASRLEIKKAYRRLSIQYNPNNNPDPEAYKYFVEYISKAYQALTDPVSRKNFKEYGHPDGWQGFQMGIAFPSFLLDIDGASGGVLLLGTVGVCIILPLMIVAFYLLRSAKYTENDVMQPKVYYLKTSLAPVKGMSILIKGVEHNFTPIRRTDKEHLQKLFVLVRRELNLGLKNVMQQHAMFWNQNPALVKNELLIQAQLTRQTAALSPSLQRHLRCILKIMPHLFEDLYKMAGTPKSPHDHGSLRNIIEAVEFSQSIIQAVPLSARKVSGNEGYATFLQLPHFSESIFKKIARKKICMFRDFREMTQEDRIKLLTQVAGLSDSEAQDVEIVLEMMPSISVDINKCELEGDIVTIPAWVAVKRENDIIGVHAHAPYFPFHKKENFWLLLVDASKNLLMWQKVSFMDEGTAITTASKAIRELNMGRGASEEEVNAAVKVAVEKVKSGSRLVVNKLRVLSDGNIKLELICLCDSWIGCDKGYEIELKDLKHSSRTRTRDGASADEMPALEEEDYLSGCSEDDKM